MIFTNNSFCSNPIISFHVYRLKLTILSVLHFLPVIVIDAMLAKQFYLCMIDVLLFHEYAFFDCNDLYAVVIFLS